MAQLGRHKEKAEAIYVALNFLDLNTQRFLKALGDSEHRIFAGVVEFPVKHLLVERGHNDLYPDVSAVAQNYSKRIIVAPHFVR
jgi:hypothetical protein